MVAFFGRRTLLKLQLLSSRIEMFTEHQAQSPATKWLGPCYQPLAWKITLRPYECAVAQFTGPKFAFDAT